MTTYTGTFDNSGILTQSGGDVTIGDAAGDVAKLINEAGATYDITDASSIDRGASPDSSIHNYGTFAKTSTSGISVIVVNFVDVGTVVCAGGNLQFYGAHNSLSGTYIGPGMIDYGPGSVSTLANLDITQSACSTNFGVVRVAGLVTIADGSTITNLAGATWNFVGDFGLTLAAGSTGSAIHQRRRNGQDGRNGNQPCRYRRHQHRDGDGQDGHARLRRPDQQFLRRIQGCGRGRLHRRRHYDRRWRDGDSRRFGGNGRRDKRHSGREPDLCAYVQRRLRRDAQPVRRQPDADWKRRIRRGDDDRLPHLERQGNDHRIGPDDRRNVDLRQRRRVDADRRRRHARATRRRCRQAARTGRAEPGTSPTTAVLGSAPRALLSISNSGLFEKTGGSGTSSVIAPKFANHGQVVVTSGTLDFEARRDRNGNGHDLARRDPGVRLRRWRGRDDCLRADRRLHVLGRRRARPHRVPRAFYGEIRTSKASLRGRCDRPPGLVGLFRHLRTFPE